MQSHSKIILKGHSHWLKFPDWNAIKMSRSLRGQTLHYKIYITWGIIYYLKKFTGYIIVNFKCNLYMHFEIIKEQKLTSVVSTDMYI